MKDKLTITFQRSDVMKVNVQYWKIIVEDDDEQASVNLNTLYINGAKYSSLSLLLYSAYNMPCISIHTLLGILHNSISA